MAWKIIKEKPFPKLNKPILIEGMPGIGNVGKIAADFLVDATKAVKMCEFFSYSFPHTVFVDRDNLVELPKIEMFYKKMSKGNDLLLLAGDIQPIDEVSCFEFCDAVLDVFQELNGSELITMGGIGLQHAPKDPGVFMTGNTKEIIKKYSFNDVNSKLYGIVGPIVGVSGLLVGLAKRRKIPAVAFLAETFGHPMYLGVGGSKAILRVLDKKLGLKIDLKKLEDEVQEVEAELVKRAKDITDMAKMPKKKKGEEGPSYIG